MLYVSPAYETIWGRPTNTLYQNPQQWLEVIHPDDRVRIAQALPQQLAGTYDTEYRILRPDGALRWIRDRAFPIQDETGQVYRIAGIAEDIASEREVQQTLKLRKRLINNHNGIVIIDEQQADHPVIYVNPAFEQITGYAAAEVVGGKHHFFHLLQGGESTQTELTRLQRALQEHRRCTVNLRTRRKDGSLFWNEVSISPIYDDQGRLSHYVAIQKDISERKRNEEQIKASLQEKEILLKEVHHRVKNNLSIVASLLEFQADYLDDPKAIQGLIDSQNRIQSMALVHERLYQSEDLGKINFKDYLQSLLDQLVTSFNLQLRQIQIQFESEEIFLNIETVTPCGIIINELVSNIFKHAFPEQQDAKIWISATQNSLENLDLITLTVQDNGVGLPPDLDIHNADSLGLQLVSLLTKQLEGNLKVSCHQETVFELTFAELYYAEGF